MTFGHEFYPFFPDRLTQISHIKNYLGGFGITFTLSGTSDSSLEEHLDDILRDIDKWLEAVNEQDFEMVGNAIMYIISTILNDRTDDSVDDSLLEKFVDKALSTSNIKHVIMSRTYLFRNWYLANRPWRSSSLFFSSFLRCLKQSEFCLDLVVDLSNANCMVEMVAPAPPPVRIKFCNRLFDLLAHLYVSGVEQKVNITYCCKKTIKLFANSVSSDGAEHPPPALFAPLADMLFTHQCLVNLHEKFLQKLLLKAEASGPEGLRVILRVAKACISGASGLSIMSNGDINSNNNEFLCSTGCNMDILRSAPQYMVLSRLAANTHTMGYGELMMALGISDDKSLEDFLFTANEANVIKCSVDPSSRDVDFRWSLHRVTNTDAIHPQLDVIIQRINQIKTSV